MVGWGQDLVFVLRGLRRTPGFSVLAVATAALGIGANVAVFSAAHAVLLRPLPYAEPDRLSFVWSDLTSSHYERAPISGPELADLRQLSQLHREFGSIWATTATLVEDGRPQSLRIGLVTANFLDVLGVAPVHGRAFLAEDEGEGAPRRIVLSGELWQRRFGGDPELIGRTLRIDGGWGFGGGLHTIVGVMPVGFEMLVPADASVPRRVDAWIPFQSDLASGARTDYYLRTVGRVKAGVPMQDAIAEFDGITRDIEREYSNENEGRRFYAVPLHADAVREAQPVLLALAGGVGLVLLIACANVANLLLTRALRRAPEMSLRVALGASRWRLARPLLLEAAVLAVASGLAGLGIARLGLTSLAWLDPRSFPRLESVRLDPAVLVFALAASLLTGLLFGLAPIWAALGGRVHAVLQRTHWSMAGDGRRPLRHALVVGEVGLSVVLLIGAGIMVRTLLNLSRVNPGYRADHVLSFKLSLPPDRYQGPEALAEFSRRVEAELAATPGVEAAGLINQLPLDDAPNWSTSYRSPSMREDEAKEADARLVTPGYFAAVGARVVSGRLFDARDDAAHPLVLVVDPLLAAGTWPGQDPIGQTLEVRVSTGRGFEPVWGQVVGVVEHQRHHSPALEVRPQVFVPFAQAPRNQWAIVLRTSADPETVVSGARAAIAAVDPDLALAGIRSLGDYVAASTSGSRFTAGVAVFFGFVSVFLAGLGLYGVIHQLVAQRTVEIGLRMALGASPGDVLVSIIRQGAALAVTGVALGVTLALWTTEPLAALSYDVSTRDPAIYATSVVGIVLVALLASYVPGRRAARLDPAVALRSE